METLSAKIKKSGQDWNDQGHRLFTDTKEAGKTFATFAQSEAKGWGEYLQERYKQVDLPGGPMKLFKSDEERRSIWMQMDDLLNKLTWHPQAEAAADEAIDAETDDEEQLDDIAAEDDGFEEVDEEELDEEEEEER